MAWLSKILARESRNGDGSLFSRGMEMEISFGAEEVPVDLGAPEPDLRLLEMLTRAGASVTLALDGPVPQFQSADKLLQKPAEAPAAQPTETKPTGPSETKPAASQESKAPPAEKVPCSICGTLCEDRPSTKIPGTTYKFCPKCKANRKRNGRPFDPPAIKGA